MVAPLALSPVPTGDSGTLEFNCDLGEGGPATLTAALFPRLGSANVACGGHAGDDSSMRYCVELARFHGVRLGAHPGLQGRFGRGTAAVTSGELAALVVDQVSRFIHVAGSVGEHVQHVKLHGSLYWLSESTPEFALAYLDVVRQVFAGRRIFAVAGGRVSTLAAEAGVEIWPEAFADRSYQPDGLLVPRDQPGAIITRADLIAARVRELVENGRVQAVDGSWLPVAARTLCFHADTPRAENLLIAAKEALKG